MDDRLIPAASLSRTQTTVPDAGHVPDLMSYDVIAVSSSGGKDSQAMLDYVCRLATELGILDRVVVIHSDLGRVEWEGTGDLAKEQADAYGVPFVLTSRIGGVSKVNGKVYKKGEAFGDLLDYAERRGAWPSNKQRWCTSEFKRGPILRTLTGLARDWRGRSGNFGACRILDCIGLRAEESAARAKKVQFTNRKNTKNQVVDSWLPILHWTEKHVWACIEESGVRHHRAYDLGMPRLSCVFCIFAPKAALVLAGTHNKALLNEYVAVEEKTGHTFRQDLSLASVREAVEAGESVGDLNTGWKL